NFTTGFITGLGGIITLPVGVPSALAASWLIQARMAGAIARIYGHDLVEDRVRTMILLSLAGDVARKAMADLGIDLGGKLPNRAIKQVPGRALVEVNKRIGLQLLTKAGGRSIAQFPKLIPVVGGVVGGAFDAVVCRMVGRTAKSLFRPASGEAIEGELIADEARRGPE
ncbi:MAG TPA: EcsC family protein, partial [Steroidobacteraceae bacterium]|nr:EcsC family protein [Steroidobacteraceae bacterium]